MKYSGNASSAGPFDLELDGFRHPSRVYAAPREVIDDVDLTLDEKRAVLASWASDACAVEAAPALRSAPGVGGIVSVDEILEALCALDRQSRENAGVVKSGTLRRDPIEGGADIRQPASVN